MTTYAELSRGNPPSKLVQRSVTFCHTKHRALDLGAGSLRNAKYLLEEGFEVDAVDKDPILKEEADKLANAKLHAVVSTYADFAFQKSEYDLIIAINSLPFAHPEEYPALFASTIEALAPGGVLCATFFGPRDDWASTSVMTFHSKEDIDLLCEKLEILELKEIEENAETIDGKPKHWHIFNLLARKAES